METFAELAASRINWIETVLKPFCQSARRTELIQAESEWLDIAGKVDVESTLWTWAWGRFPELVYEGLTGVNETHPVCVTLKNGESIIGFPNQRETTSGLLSLTISESEVNSSVSSSGISIDDIHHVIRVEENVC